MYERFAASEALCRVIDGANAVIRGGRASCLPMPDGLACVVKVGRWHASCYVCLEDGHGRWKVEAIADGYCWWAGRVSIGPFAGGSTLVIGAGPCDEQGGMAEGALGEQAEEVDLPS